MCHFSMMPAEYAVEQRKAKLALEKKCHYLPKANTNLEFGVCFLRDVTIISHTVCGSDPPHNAQSQLFSMLPHCYV